LSPGVSRTLPDSGDELAEFSGDVFVVVERQVDVAGVLRRTRAPSRRRRTVTTTASHSFTESGPEPVVVQWCLRGEGGFGYDPIFVPDGETRTSTELTAAEKDAISDRGKAFRALAVKRQVV
jgi:hypothetical protein